MAVHIWFLPHPVTNDTLKLYNNHLPSSVANPGEGPGGPTPLTFLQTEAKFFLETAPPPPHLRVWMIHLRPYLKVWIRHCSKSNLLYTIYNIVKLFWMKRPISFSTKFEYPPVPEGRVIHQTILHLLVWGFLFYPAKKSRNRQCLPS